MKLETSDLIGYIKERHRLQVRSYGHRPPTLAIVVVGNQAASASFIRAKQRYADDIGVVVLIESAKTEDELAQVLEKLNSDESVKGIVLQLPLPETFDTAAAIAKIAPNKDVDGLRPNSQFEPATAKAIMWILASLSLNIKESSFCVIGQGRLVGRPVADMLENSGAAVERCDIHTPELATITLAADIVISGAGHPGLINRSMLKEDAVVIDAGTAEAGGKLAGDATPELYNDPSVKVTPVPGGVGPATVAALFDNLLIAAEK